MLRAGAQTVENLAVLGTLGFGDALVGQVVKDTVDSSQPDPDSVLPDLHIQLLGAAEIVAAAQHVEDSLRLTVVRCCRRADGAGIMCAPSRSYSAHTRRHTSRWQSHRSGRSGRPAKTRCEEQTRPYKNDNRLQPICATPATASVTWLLVLSLPEIECRDDAGIKASNWHTIQPLRSGLTLPVAPVELLDLAGSFDDTAAAGPERVGIGGDFDHH